MVGAGIAVGYGVSTADLALGGQLARQVSELSGRGCSVNTEAEVGMRISGCAALLDGLSLSRFDLVLITLGTDEALHMMPPEQFAHDLEEFLTWVESHYPSGPKFLFVGVPVVPSIMKLPMILDSIVARRCVQLDTELKEACRRHARATYVPFNPEPGDLLVDGDRRTYARWAALLAPEVVRVLDSLLETPRGPSVIREIARQRALDDLGILDTEREPRFDRIVAAARDLFGMAGAALVFIDRDRQWTKATVGMDPTDSPRGSALGDATVNNGKLLVVEDASVDPQFMGHPWVLGRSKIRFFAGFPIEAANGERVGALCVVDAGPRSFSAAEDSLLGSLAQQVQAELWDTRKAARRAPLHRWSLRR